MNPIIQGMSSYNGKTYTYDLREPFPSFRKRCGVDVFVLGFTFIMFIVFLVCIICDSVSEDIIEVVTFIFLTFLFYSFDAAIRIYVYTKDKEIYYIELIEWRVYQHIVEEEKQR